MGGLTSIRGFKSKVVLAALSLIVLQGCSDNEPTQKDESIPSSEQALNNNASAAKADTAETIVVFSERKQHLIEPLFKAFTEQTGIDVEYLTDSAQPLLARISSQGKNTEADLFMAVDAGNLWFAAKENLLKPIESEILEKNVPNEFQDPKNRWFGLSKRARTIVYSTERVDPKNLSTYEDLASDQWKGRLCLRTSQKVYNQSLVAMLLAQHKQADVEKTLAGWVKNLATPVFSSDGLLIEAIAAGQCDVGIVNTYYLGEIQAKDPEVPVKIFWPNQGKDDTGVHVNITGAGVTKHAQHPEAAQQLLEWLVSDKAQAQFAKLNYEYPIVDGIELDPMVSAWGKFKTDETSIDQAGKNQATAIMLMDEAGYK